MARILDANEKFVGKEPKFSGVINDSELGSTLSWYSQNKKSKDSQKYANDFIKKKLKLDASSVVKTKPPQFGFICRIVTNGGVLSEERQKWFDEQVELIREEIAKVQTNIVIEKVKKGPSIQDRIREKANECIGELEGQIDILIDSKFTANVMPFAVMHTLAIKDGQTKFIVDWIKTKRNEFDEVLNTDDKELKEGYSNFSKTEVKKIIAYCDQVILDCQKVSAITTASRKPRKRKAKSPEQLTAKMNFMPEFKELSLTSVKSTDIIGAMSLWVYNTKTRKLGVYHAEDAGGLSVKGSSILNFVESKSMQKKLRKPEQMLPEVLNGGKVFLRNVMESIRAVDSKLTGRINADTILLKVTK